MPIYDPVEATAAIRELSKRITPEQRAEILRRAHIFDENGNFDERFFSRETIEKDKAYRKVK